MLEKIYSGGNTGASIAAWRAAAVCGVPTGGWVRDGFLTDDGAHPEFAKQFGAVEYASDIESAVNEQNIKDSDATIWFGQTTTAGAHETVSACLRCGRPFLPVYPAASFEPAHVATWILENDVKAMHVTGNREREERGITERVEGFLCEVFRLLGHELS